MDGVIEHECLFIITTNNSLDDVFYSRPNRILYHLKHTYLKKSDVFEFLYKNIEESVKTSIQEIAGYLGMHNLTYDIIHKFVVELNRGISFSFLKRCFNLKAESILYTCTVITDKGATYNGNYELNPLSRGHESISFKDKDKDEWVRFKWSTYRDEHKWEGSKLVVYCTGFRVILENSYRDSEGDAEVTAQESSLSGLPRSCCDITTALENVPIIKSEIMSNGGADKNETET